ncbi:MAG: segregation/condensation protein A, partial [Acutalibacteraceae bacterium]|nr:segregation/condensation protein A [Acutalibacteraceae bacterium]
MDNPFLYKTEEFEGPLDLLLQLIARNKLNIYDIKISVLVEQYLQQINLMKENEMDIASEFLEMASRLLYIKTVSLLPKHDEVE